MRSLNLPVASTVICCYWFQTIPH